MKLQVLISTMNQTDVSFVGRILPKNENVDFLVINQLTIVNKNDVELSEKLFCFAEKGISKSRNRAIENSKGNINLIADDDITYINNFEKIVIQAYKKHPNADIITFKMQNRNKKMYKNYPFVHNLSTLRQVSSVEITFKRKSIIKNNLKFNTYFGIGSKYPIGEEALFLRDAYKKGLKIIFYPSEILRHSSQTTAQKFTKKSIRAKAIFAKKWFGFLAPVWILFESIKYYKKYRHKFTILEYWHNSYFEFNKKNSNLATRKINQKRKMK